MAYNLKIEITRYYKISYFFLISIGNRYISNRILGILFFFNFCLIDLDREN